MYYLYKNTYGSLFSFRDDCLLDRKALVIIEVLYKDENMYYITNEEWLQGIKHKRPSFDMEELEPYIVYKSESYDDIIAQAAILRL